MHPALKKDEIPYESFILNNTLLWSDGPRSYPGNTGNEVGIHLDGTSNKSGMFWGSWEETSEELHMDMGRTCTETQHEPQCNSACCATILPGMAFINSSHNSEHLHKCYPK